MPSFAFEKWRQQCSRKLNELEMAHRALAGKGPGRRYATQQINHAYLMLVASQFQGFCRDLHSECVDHFVRRIGPATVSPIVRLVLMDGRNLDKLNATPQTLQHDFRRLGFDLNSIVKQPPAAPKGVNTPPVLSPPCQRFQRLARLNAWRNAIVHEDFDAQKLGGETNLGLADVRAFRKLCNRIAVMLNKHARKELHRLTGEIPWL